MAISEITAYFYVMRNILCLWGDTFSTEKTAFSLGLADAHTLVNCWVYRIYPALFFVGMHWSDPWKKSRATMGIMGILYHGMSKGYHLTNKYMYIYIHNMCACMIIIYNPLYNIYILLQTCTMTTG